MPNYVDLGARLLALRKMTFPSADKALSYCRSLGDPACAPRRSRTGVFSTRWAMRSARSTF